jgi:hypothetical protein
MPLDLTLRPSPSEYNPWYAGYITGVPDGSILSTLEAQTGETLQLLSSIAEAKGGHRYAPGKWSIKETVLHVIDAERVFSMRALCIGRGETKALPGFEQDDYVVTSEAAQRTMLSLLTEYTAVRSSTMQLLRNLPEAAWSRSGIASEKPVSFRAIVYIIAGHERHHVKVLRERYL